MAEEGITAYDGRGRKVVIPRDEWEKRVLPHNLRQAWDDPQALYAHILRALDDEFAHVVLDAAERLAAIDPQPERGIVTLAITQMRNDLPEKAERTLCDFLDEHGESAYALTNLAKVQHDKGETELALETVRRGLALDPNQDNGLSWYAALVEERDGEGGGLAAMREVARTPGAWRPHLWVAQWELQHGDLEQALLLYRHVIQTAPTEGDALAHMSADLGRTGHPEEALDLVAPAYEASVHGPTAGLNLARAAVHAGRLDEARRLLASVRALALPPFNDAIDEIEADIATASPALDLGEAPPLQPISFEVPVWSVCLGSPRWLLPPKAPRVKRVLVGVFSDAMRDPGRNHGRVERGSGRANLTRCVTLRVAEGLQLHSNAKTACVLSVIPGQGVVVFGAPTTPEHWSGYEVDGGPSDVIVTGCFVPDALEIHLWDTRLLEPIGTVRVPAPSDGVGVAAQAAAAVLDALERGEYLKPVTSPFGAVPEERADHYAFALEQTLQLVLVANGVFPPDVLLGERLMFETIFELAEATDLPQARLMALTALCAGMRYSSGIVDAYRAPLLRMVEDERGTGAVLDLAAPFAMRWLADEEAFRAERRRLRALDDDAYREWLDSL